MSTTSVSTAGVAPRGNGGRGGGGGGGRGHVVGGTFVAGTLDDAPKGFGGGVGGGGARPGRREAPKGRPGSGGGGGGPPPGVATARGAPGTAAVEGPAVFGSMGTKRMPVVGTLIFWRVAIGSGVLSSSGGGALGSGLGGGLAACPLGRIWIFFGAVVPAASASSFALRTCTIISTICVQCIWYFAVFAPRNKWFQALLQPGIDNESSSVLVGNSPCM